MDVKIKYDMEKYASFILNGSRLEDAVERILMKGIVPLIQPEQLTNQMPVEIAPTFINKERAKTNNRITSPYGMRVHPKTKKITMHNGIDLAGEVGAAIYSFDAGIVTVVGSDGKSGNFIVIKHENGMVSSYSHLSNQAVEKGQMIDKGERIGSVGMTGQTTGPHLHFRLKQNNSDVDPELFIGNRRIVE